MKKREQQQCFYSHNTNEQPVVSPLRAEHPILPLPLPHHMPRLETQQAERNDKQRTHTPTHTHTL